MVGESSISKQMCQLRADVCEKCAQSCDSFGDDQMMKNCANTCRTCAQSCRTMTSVA